MKEEERRKRYLEILALPSDGTATAHGKALARAHELRKFEIGNYWTRATYFWGFQLVAFGALALAVDEGRVAPELVLIVSIVGALTAFAAILTAYGSKFWQKNWERHVDMLEPAEEGRLTQTVLVTDDFSFSVSRVNERLLELVMFGWLLSLMIATAVLLCDDLQNMEAGVAARWQIGVTLLALILGGIWILRGAGLLKLLKGNHAQRSDLIDRAYDFESMTKRSPEKPDPPQST